MSRQAACGREEARRRTAVAALYFQVADIAAGDDADAANNVAAGNAVLAGIAAADALCCVRLGKRSRAQDHHAAVTMLEQVNAGLAKDLATVLAIKDLAHYGESFLGDTRLTSTLRAASRLVTAAQEALTT